MANDTGKGWRYQATDKARRGAIHVWDLSQVAELGHNKVYIRVIY